MMKVVFFGNDTPKNAAIRYRVQAWADRLTHAGHRCVVCLPASIALFDRLYNGRSRWMKALYLLLVLIRRITQLRHVIGADAIIFRGPVFPYGPPILERIIHFLNPRMAFDIDDAVWEPPAHVDSPFLFAVDYNWAPKMCKLCRLAIVGNAYLKEHVEKTGIRTIIIPTCVDMALHREKPETSSSATVVLGWTGLKDNLGYLSIIEPTLQALAKTHPFTLSIATVGREYALEGVQVENHSWRLDQEIHYLQHADIGLMPLTDTPRARGKCAFKAIQHMAVGTPCILSPVGMNATLIQDGVNGFLADTPEEWYEKLERLITDSALRERMGHAARATILAGYAHEAHFTTLVTALEQLAASSES